MKTNRTLYLVKDNDNLCCHCACESAYISFPPQMDCPWCGCGWLFTCTSCRKAFTFARAVEVNESWEELAHRDLDGKYGQNPSADDIRGWIAAMQELHAEVELGQQYVCLDGLFIPANANGVEFQGWHSEHRLDFVPQVKACEDYFVKEEILANRDYWLSTALPKDE
jgi:hypothetical protein